MGRKSFELHSQPGKGLFHQLEHEQKHQIIKIVVSSSLQPTIFLKDFTKDVIICQSWSNVVDSVFQLRHQITEAWNIGGPQLYQSHLLDLIAKQRQQDCVYLTKLDQVFNCDVFYPIKYLDQLTLLDQSQEQQEGDVKYVFCVLACRGNHENTS